MTQSDYIKDIAEFGLKNDQKGLLSALNELVEHSKKTRKVNLALELQTIIKQAVNEQQGSGLVRIDSPQFFLREQNRALQDLVIEKLKSDYRLKHLVSSEYIEDELNFFIKEHQNIKKLQKIGLPISNKVLFYGPSGCGKTLASYVLSGELDKEMIVVNIGAIVSSKLGETSKNLGIIFKQAIQEECIIFIDEFDTIGKLRDYNQDHAEMKRVVNTILQLCDYLPQSSILIAATNQIKMIDDALLRRFDLKLNLELPNKEQIKELINKTIPSDQFIFDYPNKLDNIIENCVGASFYTIQNTLVKSIKRSLLLNEFTSEKSVRPLFIKINTKLWENMIQKEKIAGLNI